MSQRIDPDARIPQLTRRPPVTIIIDMWHFDCISSSRRNGYAGRRENRPARRGSGETMKLIIAIIRSENLGRVEAALNQGKVCLLSVSQVLGSGWESGYKEMYRGREIKLRQPKVRLEIAVQNVH